MEWADQTGVTDQGLCVIEDESGRTVGFWIGVAFASFQKALMKRSEQGTAGQVSFARLCRKI